MGEHTVCRSGIMYVVSSTWPNSVVNAEEEQHFLLRLDFHELYCPQWNWKQHFLRLTSHGECVKDR